MQFLQYIIQLLYFFGSLKNNRRVNEGSLQVTSNNILILYTDIYSLRVARFKSLDAALQGKY